MSRFSHLLAPMSVCVVLFHPLFSYSFWSLGFVDRAARRSDFPPLILHGVSFIGLFCWLFNSYIGARSVVALDAIALLLIVILFLTLGLDALFAIGA
ncbi:MAG: hypothetical protein AAGM38_09770 [Pseudomonadota bacterium]